MNLRSSAAPTGPERADGAMGVIDRFVHPSLRQNPDLLYRTRTLIGLLLTFAAIFVLADLILLLIPLPRLNLEISLGMSNRRRESRKDARESQQAQSQG